ncbi:MAG: methyltransferase domain-containing protein [Candidatus Dormibacteraeota bacterium]|nr:methyltransferase domain-containing protein [Candidatus Dormibacteraeota bacterium]
MDERVGGRRQAGDTAGIRATFGPVAANYSRSFFHADPTHLDELVELARPRAADLALDVATGTGNTAFALAPHVAHVIGLDLTPAMLVECRRNAERLGGVNLSWVQGDACRLPFASGVIDLYTARAAPHHFSDLAGALSEATRVLKRGGHACFIDCSPPEAAREHLHEIEIGRDPSHVLSRTLAEWTQLLGEAGLRVETAQRRELDWDFEGWMANLAIEPHRVEVLAARLEAAKGEAALQLRPERRAGRLRHAYWHALIRTVKP